MYVRQWDVSAPSINPLPRPPPKKIHPCYYAGRVSNAWYTAQNGERKLTIVHVFTVINLTNSFKTSQLKSLKTLDSWALIGVPDETLYLQTSKICYAFASHVTKQTTSVSLEFQLSHIASVKQLWNSLTWSVWAYIEPWRGLITQHKLGINCQKAGKL